MAIFDYLSPDDKKKKSMWQQAVDFGTTALTAQQAAMGSLPRSAFYDALAYNPVSRRFLQETARNRSVKEGATMGAERPGEPYDNKAGPNMLDIYYGWTPEALPELEMDEATRQTLATFKPPRTPKKFYTIPDSLMQFQPREYDEILALEEVAKAVRQLKEGERLNLTPFTMTGSGRALRLGGQGEHAMMTPLHIGGYSHGVVRRGNRLNALLYDVYDFWPPGYTKTYGDVQGKSIMGIPIPGRGEMQAQILDRLGEPFGLFKEMPYKRRFFRRRR